MITSSECEENSPLIQTLFPARGTYSSRPQSILRRRSIWQEDLVVIEGWQVQLQGPGTSRASSSSTFSVSVSPAPTFSEEKKKKPYGLSAIMFKHCAGTSEFDSSPWDLNICREATVYGFDMHPRKFSQRFSLYLRDNVKTTRTIDFAPSPYSYELLGRMRRH
ncbi:uncharacterized protein RCC_11177 [Ramularia collo-cygni]|uniref:Uncharacterized protein n=1 Tax=Ramularia collo-cygni TaxID=112498 RepID=A0A2D3VHB4_9PEZI|nr:uncharacterized protein RCC_11177 [Ramularia collo-cygni]CZT25445.1 uncharacterized protein RCC_11177 [Ramularia collo-cygni]